MDKINNIDALTIKARLDADERLTIIDIRESDELKICKIDDTIHIPMMEIPNQLDKLNKQDEIIILCRSGVRSKRVCEFLQGLGFKNTKNFSGGILDWIKQVDFSMQSY